MLPGGITPIMLKKIGYAGISYFISIKPIYEYAQVTKCMKDSENNASTQT